MREGIHRYCRTMLASVPISINVETMLIQVGEEIDTRPVEGYISGVAYASEP